MGIGISSATPVIMRGKGSGRLAALLQRPSTVSKDDCLAQTTTSSNIDVKRT